MAACGLAAAQPAPRGERPGYFIEFRARPSVYFGHTFIIYGQIDAAGRVVERHHAGLVPGDDFWQALVIPIPVRGEVRADPDDDARPTDAIYRRRLTAVEYRRLLAKLRLLRATQRQWHFIFFNCNDFVIEIAETVGLNRLPSWFAPRLWVEGLHVLNRD